MLEPKITVLMAAHNAERFLKDAIQSILGQSFSDFEMIIFDDASTDATAKILADCKDKRIRIVTNKENLGLTRSLNLGLEIARGKYMARMDADDIAEPNRLQVQNDFLDSNPDVALVGSFAQFIDEQGNPLRVRKVPTSAGVIKYEMLFGNCFIHSSTVFRKEIIISEGGYNAAFRYAQDYELFSRLIKKYKLANIPQVLLRLRLHRESVTAKSDSQEIVRQNTLNVIFANMNEVAKIDRKLFDQIQELLIIKRPKKGLPLQTLIDSLAINRRLYHSFHNKERPVPEDARLIKKEYVRRRNLALKKFFLGKLKG